MHTTARDSNEYEFVKEQCICLCLITAYRLWKAECMLHNLKKLINMLLDSSEKLAKDLDEEHRKTRYLEIISQ